MDIKFNLEKSKFLAFEYEDTCCVWGSGFWTLTYSP